MMKLFLTLLLLSLLLTTTSHSKDYLRVGFFAGDVTNSEEKSNISNNPVVEQDYGGGFTGGGQIPLFAGFYLYGDFQYELRGLRTEYEYLEENTDQNYNSSKLKALNVITGVHAGLRFRFLSLFYIGGGYYTGKSKINYDKNHYESLNDNSDGYQASETQDIYGHYTEAGLMFTGAQWGVGFTVRRSPLRTGQYQTLGNNRLNYNRDELIIDYIQAFD